MSYLPAGRALASPLGVAMIALLVVNDHLLKGSGLLPGWLTGKLSDVAGLVVAPLLVTWLVRARSRRTELAAFALVAAVFASIKLSHGAAAALVAALDAIGIGWRIVVDPTDLLALAALPIGWWLLQRRQVRSLPGAPAIGLAAAAACLASGEGDPPPARWTTAAYVVNDTGAPIDISLRFYEGQLSCSQLAPVLGRALAPAAFGEGIRFRLEPGETLPIVPDDVLLAAGLTDPTMPPTPADSTFSPCGVALLQADGLPDWVAWWHDADLQIVQVPLTSDDEGFELSEEALRRGRIDLITNEQGRLEAHARGDVRLVRATRTLEPSSCPAPALRVQWSLDAAESNIPQRVSSVRTLADGCLDIALGEHRRHGDTRPRERLLLCVPPGAFPFAEGDELGIAEHELPDGGHTLRLYDPHGTRSLTAFAGISSLTGELEGSLHAEECAGDRMRCGAYTVPMALQLAGEVLRPGESRLVGDAHVYLGRSENVLAAPHGCEVGRDRLGSHADAVIVYREESP